MTFIHKYRQSELIDNMPPPVGSHPLSFFVEVVIMRLDEDHTFDINTLRVHGNYPNQILRCNKNNLQNTE